MSTMTDKMSESSKVVLTDKVGVGLPKKGGRFRCDAGGMEVEVTTGSRFIVSRSLGERETMNQNRELIDRRILSSLRGNRHFSC